MKSITIQGTKRESVGKKSTKALRDADLVPCVVYGGKEPLSFSAEEKAFKNLVYTPDAHTATLVIDGKEIVTVLQDIQFHPITDKILHADFYQLKDNKAVIMEVPVKFTGRSVGVSAGGVLRPSFRKLKVKAIPANLPDEINVDITSLNVGNKLYIESLKNDKFVFMHPDNAVVVAVKTSRNALKDVDMDLEDQEEAAEVANQSPDVPTTEEKN